MKSGQVTKGLTCHFMSALKTEGRPCDTPLQNVEKHWILVKSGTLAHVERKIWQNSVPLFHVKHKHGIVFHEFWNWNQWCYGILYGVQNASETRQKDKQSRRYSVTVCWVLNLCTRCKWNAFSDTEVLSLWDFLQWQQNIPDHNLEALKLFHWVALQTKTTVVTSDVRATFTNKTWLYRWLELLGIIKNHGTCYHHNH